MGKLCDADAYERLKPEIEALLALPETRRPQDDRKDIFKALSLMFYINRGTSIAFFAASLAAFIVSATYLVKGVTTTETIEDSKPAWRNTQRPPTMQVAR